MSISNVYTMKSTDKCGYCEYRYPVNHNTRFSGIVTSYYCKHRAGHNGAITLVSREWTCDNFKRKINNGQEE